LEISRLKREVAKLKAERDILKNHLGQRPPVGVETVEVYPFVGRERPTAFWWHATPQKNMVHGLLRT
jgi:transposase